MSVNAIDICGITKSFGEVVANDGIDLSVREGEILALLGENGSGKTTLMNMLSGIYRPDSGHINIYGKEAYINSPEDAKQLGIGMIHQHFKLVDVMTAADNILFGASKNEPFILTKKRYERVKKISERYELNVDMTRHVRDMSVGEKQTLEILKVLYFGARILILDEPTSVLTPQESVKLFSVLRKMKNEGCAVIIITHKLNEVLEISDTVTVLRRGKSVATVKTASATAQSLTELMVGRKVDLMIERPPVKRGENLLHIHHLSIINAEGIQAVDDVSFDLDEGEILGVAGVSGSGQKELCEAIAGLQKIQKGAILYKSENIEGKTPRDIIRLGISMSFIPEDRLGMGLAASLDITDNMMLKSYRKPWASPFVDRKFASAMARKVIKQLDIVTPGISTPVRLLSGGNVQKVLLGREIEANPRVLITAYPVRGLDINSSYTIYNLLNRQKESGSGVLFIGEDLDVMLELCDRIMVLYRGKVTGILNAAETTKEQLGLLMTGVAI
ncbi:MAG: ABC transporter ATP-binding protein [Eubacteriales bacterium]|nr:ABC transporter ATP-binding protein [Eubacteriales bacterium]